MEENWNREGIYEWAEKATEVLAAHSATCKQGSGTLPFHSRLLADWSPLFK